MNTHKNNITVMWIAVFLLVLSASNGGAVTGSNPVNEPETTNARVMIGEFKSRIIEIQTEILELKQDLEWLNYKVTRITLSNRPVSWSISNSVQQKTQRINSLENQKAYCMERLAFFQALLPPSEKQTLLPKKRKLFQELSGKIEAAGLSDWIEIELDQTSGECRLKTVLPILFASGSAVIVDEYRNFLKTFAALIRDLDGKIVVDGYADIDPIHTKKYPSNFELGATRAANIVHSLVKYGVNPSVFKIASTGKYRHKPLTMSKNKALERYVNITMTVSG
ncbi:MAG: OmpA family protein [Desulfobacterales bacterium]|nr:OmpA family protein [Desulfobacterales bacterium]